ncbi:MAG: hypothetical protein ABL921_33340 [Pirellula sp.]
MSIAKVSHPGSILMICVCIFTFVGRPKHRQWPRFKYCDGRRNRYIDARQAVDRLISICDDIETHINKCYEGDRDAIKKCVSVTKEVFGVVDFNDEKRIGLSIDEMIGLLVAFLKFSVAQFQIDQEKMTKELERLESKKGSNRKWT